VFIRTQGGGSAAGQSPATSGKPGDGQGRATGAGRTQWLSGAAGRGAGALFRRPWSSWISALARARYGLELARRAARALPLIPPPPGCLHGLRHPLLLWQQRPCRRQAVVAGECPAERPCGWWRSPDRNGAKTVSLKSVGLAAPDGPGRSVSFPAPVRHGCLVLLVLADIGDEQSPGSRTSPPHGHVRRIRPMPGPACRACPASASRQAPAWRLASMRWAQAPDPGVGRGAGDRPVAPSGPIGPRLTLATTSLR